MYYRGSPLALTTYLSNLARMGVDIDRMPYERRVRELGLQTPAPTQTRKDTDIPRTEYFIEKRDLPRYQAHDDLIKAGYSPEEEDDARVVELKSKLEELSTRRSQMYAEILACRAACRPLVIDITIPDDEKLERLNAIKFKLGRMHKDLSMLGDAIEDIKRALNYTPERSMVFWYSPEKYDWLEGTAFGDLRDLGIDIKNLVVKGVEKIQEIKRKKAERKAEKRALKREIYAKYARQEREAAGEIIDDTDMMLEIHQEEEKVQPKGCFAGFNRLFKKVFTSKVTPEETIKADPRPEPLMKWDHQGAIRYRGDIEPIAPWRLDREVHWGNSASARARIENEAEDLLCLKKAALRVKFTQ